MKSIFTIIGLMIAVNFCLGDGGPVQPFPEDVSFPGDNYSAPHQHPWYTDDVTWVTTDPLPQYQYRTANGVLGNYFYVFGEQNNPFANAYNITTDTWEPSTQPPLGNCNWCGVATDDAFYIVGRYDGAYHEEVQKFVPTGGGPTGTWSQVADYPLAMCGIAAAWDGGDLIYAAGGGGTMGSVAYAYKYSISTDTWTQIASMPAPMKYHGGWYAAGKFMVYGGITPGCEYTLFIYDPTTNTWTTGASLIFDAYFATFNTTGTDLLMFSVGRGGYYDWGEVQVYDPATNIWTMETSLPTGNGLNAAGYIGNGQVISAGGYPTTYTCYKGTGFPVGLPPVFDIEVEMIPYGTPIQIPANGGEFSFQVSLINNEPSTVEFDVWTTATLPDGSETDPLLSVSLIEPAGWSVERDRTQVVPANTPSGEYQYNIYVGLLPANIWDEDHFNFEKLVTGGGGVVVSDWANWGEEFGDSGVSSETGIPSEFALYPPYPNPFNQRVAISYKLKAASNMELIIYDIMGRQAAVLVDGYQNAGSHEITFDAKDLVSGVYFVMLDVGDFRQTRKILLIK